MVFEWSDDILWGEDASLGQRLRQKEVPLGDEESLRQVKANRVSNGRGRRIGAKVEAKRGFSGRCNLIGRKVKAKKWFHWVMTPHLDKVRQKEFPLDEDVSLGQRFRQKEFSVGNIVSLGERFRQKEMQKYLLLERLRHYGIYHCYTQR